MNHLWVDCFILDELPASPLLARLFTFRQQMIFGLAMGHRRVIHFAKYKGLSRLFVRVLSTVGKVFPLPLLFRVQEKWARAGKKGKKLYFSNYQPDFQYCISRYDWEKPLIQGDFQGYKLPIPKGYDAILRMLYGRYELLPREEDRVPSHEEMI